VPGTSVSNSSALIVPLLVSIVALLATEEFLGWGTS
jgi:hypothetical protein